MAFPDGLALSPDSSILYVSNNDPSRPIWLKFPLNEDLDLDPGSGSVFFDATAWTEAGEAGSPAGLVVHSTGVVVGGWARRGFLYCSGWQIVRQAPHARNSDALRFGSGRKLALYHDNHPTLAGCDRGLNPIQFSSEQKSEAGFRINRKMTRTRNRNHG